MKTPRRRTLLAWVGVMGLTIANVLASGASMGLASFPVNLGAGADPKMIPIGEIPVWTNYGYGIAETSTAAIPMQSGVMEWKRGLEFNLNLASAFGIELECNDITNIPSEAITLRMRDWPCPAYSPYRKDQVLSATLVVLIRMYGVDAERPLKVNIIVDNEAERVALSRYSGEYLMDQETGKLVKGRLEGVEWKREENGLFCVKFPNITAVKNEADAAPLLVWMPIVVGGGDSDTKEIVLIPNWVGKRNPENLVECIWHALPRALNAFSAKKGENANPLHESNFHVYSSGNRIQIYQREDVANLQEILASAFWASALTDAANDADGCTLLCRVDHQAGEAWKSFFAGAKKLESDPSGLDRDIKYEQKFRFDFKTGKLVEGSIHGWTIEPIENGGWKMVSLAKPPEEKAE